MCCGNFSSNRVHGWETPTPSRNRGMGTEGGWWEGEEGRWKKLQFILLIFVRSVYKYIQLKLYLTFHWSVDISGPLWRGTLEGG